MKFSDLREFAHRYRVLHARKQSWRSTPVDTEISKWFTAECVRPRIFILLAADFGNLGDFAIAQAQTDVLRDLTSGTDVLRVPLRQTGHFIDLARDNLGPDDIITFSGGGSFGDMYHDAEYLRRKIVRGFPNQRILAFPQSIVFSETTFGNWWLALSRRTYRRHPCFTILARDAGSLTRAARYFPATRRELATDVVLSMRVPATAMRRSGILLALRRDGEKALPLGAQELLVRSLADLANIAVADTDVDRPELDEKSGRLELAALLKQFSDAEVVVTDRLHGAIFAMLTGTPCVVFDNSTGKIHDFIKTWGLVGSSVRLLGAHEVADVPTIVDELMRRPPERAPIEQPVAGLKEFIRNYFASSIPIALDRATSRSPRPRRPRRPPEGQSNNAVTLSS